MSEITGHFAVPIYTGNIAEPNLGLVQDELTTAVDTIKNSQLFKKHPRAEPNTHSLTDVSFSSNFIADWNLDLFAKELEEHIFKYMRGIGTSFEKVQRYRILQSWMTMTNKDEYAPIHSHGGADLSGVYYFQTNGDDGDIFFNSPNVQQEHAHVFEHLPAWHSSKPEVGKIILFPGWLRHGTRTNTTTNERISLSFNIVFDRGHF
jgi:uncharacterized protein (TIGR02466 family)